MNSPGSSLQAFKCERVIYILTSWGINVKGKAIRDLLAFFHICGVKCKRGYYLGFTAQFLLTVEGVGGEEHLSLGLDGWLAEVLYESGLVELTWWRERGIGLHNGVDIVEEFTGCAAHCHGRESAIIGNEAEDWDTTAGDAIADFGTEFQRTTDPVVIVGGNHSLICLVHVGLDK
jgi:hypothetical protein